MNLRDQSELEMLKHWQEALQRQLANLTVDIDKLSSRLSAQALPVQEIPPLEVTPLETTAVPPAGPVIAAAVPPPLPPVIPMATTTATPIAEMITAVSQDTGGPGSP